MSIARNKAQLENLEQLIDELTQAVSDCAKRHRFTESTAAAETLQRTSDSYSTLKELFIHEEYVSNMLKEGVDTEFLLPGEGPLNIKN